MISFGFTRRRLFLLLVAVSFLLVFSNLTALSDTDIAERIDHIRIPGVKKKPWHSGDKYEDTPEPTDAHPISVLMKDADNSWRAYENSRSQTFRQTVSKYRNKYGRHPPPGFTKWYRYARKRNVHNVDDFEQIMDDLRPFWAVEPHVIRNLAANMAKATENGVSSMHIRDHKVVKQINGNWRLEALVTLVKKFIKHLPDMDIAMNRLDQPRVVVDWDVMQEMLRKELATRQAPPEAFANFTSNLSHLLNVTNENDEPPKEDPQWFNAPGKQYMEIARTACPPESHARKTDSDTADVEGTYKMRLGGIITNFNLSSDLCTVGPEIQDQHGLLYASSSMTATKRLVPIFGECKVNVNSDILFPANMYWKDDDRYNYNGRHDEAWEKKQDVMIWRGVTSGGAQDENNWRKMHRQRLVMLANGTEMAGKEVRILTEQPEKRGEYENYRQFHPSAFADNHTDVGFTETTNCIPNECPFYKDVWTLKKMVDLPDQFRYKFLVDVDGHSFSGRWRAFLESKSLGIKATIFREWHDSRLFAWRHFVPMDNRYDDLYTLLTYFLGVGTSARRKASGADQSMDEKAYVARHDAEGKRIANQGSEWAKKVLRKEDMEVYMFRLLLEYARVVDDNRDRIGYSGDGSELDKYDGVTTPDEIPH